MKSRNILADTDNVRLILAQLILIPVLTFVIFIIDGSAAGTILSLGVTISVSIYNVMVIRFFELLNDKIRILNYVAPAIPFLLLILFNLGKPLDDEALGFIILLMVFIGLNISTYFWIMSRISKNKTDEVNN